MINISKQFNGKSKKRPVRKEGKKLVSKHYWIDKEIEIDLIKIASFDNNNISEIVREGLNEYINKRKQLNKEIWT